MGIRNLNQYLRNNCPKSIRCINIADLSGKRIAVDISIYLYKYEAENALLENMYVMLSIFRQYNIIPIFIFDGKPPIEKKALLIKRKEDRQVAIEEYNKLDYQLKDKDNLNESDKQDIIASMDQLKKQIVQINKDKIDKVKNLIRAYGATYYDAPGEADELCALLVINKKVWACLSEDMDMFVYGAIRVLRYFSLIGHTVVLYYMKGILEETNMTQKEFKEICILSGTDYNINAEGITKDDKINLNITLKYFRKYKDCKSNLSFYEWLTENTEYITDIELLEKINNIFDVEKKMDSFKNIKIINGPIIHNEIKNIMKDEDFIFID
jgi:flap endonuclease-1